MIFTKRAIATGILAMTPGLSIGCAEGPGATSPQVSPADVERAACAEIPDADRDQGPFGRRERIIRVDELREKIYPKAPPQPVGAAVYLRATPGMTEQYLGRVIECHLAHRALVGENVPDRDSPLYADKATISVSSTATAFRVSIKSLRGDVARSVIESANKLAMQ
jgi:hypothetical protein